MSCTHATTCPFVTLFAGKPSLRIWTEWYCEGRYNACARYSLSSRGESVPPWLLPNGRSLDAPNPPVRAA
jgi:hypothetical protein